VRTGRHRALNVLAMVTAIREQHLELTAPITPRRLWRVLEAEEIRVVHGRIRRPARARGFDGAYAICIRHDMSPRDAWRWALHEYAHIRLGHFAEGEETVRQLTPCRRDDPRELEAKLFARLLALGPAATPDTPAIAGIFDELTSQHYRTIVPEQLPLSIQEKPREIVVHPRADAVTAGDVDPRVYERRVVRRGAQMIGKTPASWLSGRVVTDRMTDDDQRLKFYDETVGAARFTDARDVRWWIYNFRVITDASGRRRRERVSDFMSEEIEYRVFVNSIGVSRIYRFRDRREQRAYRVKHLDRQLRESRRVALSAQAAKPSLIKRP
jgi:hypothetical protein